MAADKATRVCTKCNQTKSVDELFSKWNHKRGKLYVASYCRACSNATENARQRDRRLTEKGKADERTRRVRYREMYPERVKEKDRNSRLKYEYGITAAEYDATLVRQGGVCRLCGKLNRDGRRLHVDHCHTSGEVRELLCDNCNRGLGSFADNPQLLRKAASYLIRHQKRIEKLNEDETN